MARRRTVLRSVLCVLVGATALVPPPPSKAWAGLRHVDPAQVIPLEKVAPELRDSVAEVIRDSSFHRQGKPETFPCNPRIYLSLLNEPAITLGLWKDLSPHPAKLRQVGPNRYEGTDGSGTTATWEFVLRSPRLHVLFCNLDYLSPRGNARLNGRIVIIVRTGFYKEASGDHWVQHDVEAYVKIDSKGWKAVAVTVRPLIEKLLEDQVQEAGLFVSLMGRLVEMYPDWATTVTSAQDEIHPESRRSFTDLISRTRRPGAHAGRPTLAQDAATVRR